MRIVVVLALTSTAAADPVRVDAGVTGSSVAIADRDGAGMVVEIKQIVGSRLAIGGRVEIGVLYGGHVGDDRAAVGIAMAACGLVKAEYHFVDGTVRPFAALGAGAYTIGSETVDGGPNMAAIVTDTGRYVGVAPELGVDVGRVRLAATYNALLGARLAAQSQNYVSVELSFRFAGP